MIARVESNPTIVVPAKAGIHQTNFALILSMKYSSSPIFLIVILEARRPKYF
jgi:hypothetical protein